MSVSVFDDTVASIYNDTRQLDFDAAMRAILDVLTRTMGDSPVRRVLDAGCGTGRLVRPLLEAIGRQSLRGRCDVVGIDHSEAMLEHARRDLKELASFCQADIADYCSLHRDYYDIVLLNWVLHCCDNWADTLAASLGSIRIGGCLLWLEESGDLYRAIDCAWAHEDHPAPGSLRRLLDAYWESIHEVQRGHGLPITDPSARIGPSLRTATERLESHLRVQGFELFDSEVFGWSRTVSYHWLKDVVIGGRAFSNMRLVPDWVHCAALASCPELAPHPDDDSAVLLTYSLRAKTAKRLAYRRQGHMITLAPV